MPRLFTGLFVPDSHHAALAGLREEITGVRWMTSDQWHATLVFIGSVSADEADEIQCALADVQMSDFQSRIDGVGAFPEARHARVLWAGVAPHGPLETLYNLILEAVVDVLPKFDRPSRPYHPHVTVGRPRGRRRVNAQDWVVRHSDLRTDPWNVSSFALIQSDTHPDGARYLVRRSYPFSP